MSVAGGSGGESSVDPKMTAGIGIIGGLVGIYLTPISPVIGPLLAALGAVCAIVWGADAIARVASYGLGTGVPSIGYMSLAVGVIGALAGLAGGIMLGSAYTILAPLLGVVISVILGGVIALIAKKIVGMKIPVLVTGTMELTGAAAISVLGFSAAIAGSYAMAPILKSVVVTGFIGLLFILNTMAIQHPFNACLGPQEDRARTLKLAGSTGFMAMTIVGLLGMGTSKAWWVIAIIGALAWFITFRMFLQASKDDAASVAWSGMWPKEEEH
ncbi:MULTISPECIES: tetrahydromethanopterin S-methyltransferase subunit MtrC [Methanobacterium]|jgi:tetrahydromethanopterin S-methyltransferase subunit C|uniref:Tetrahydromethanopterin S-methyltransferase subunit C n=1 Tax=Methanobacterium formicicum TaxID=2162 RepID=A0A090I5I0_METFO|nr:MULTISPECIES: tetrahydromethanopterin S-methyltransferase subunit C [Methanobacterium]AIS31749.1 tetrahydromethanopterin S-methyltransferase subunit C MtrC [Methanobacterium formicicum]KUK75001.1 MAG: Tetrahydromethanopterin S-methyltransferase subunit C [Methanobacterium sp. 42_16]MDG3548197.1 tetrahydromethanopterin S-methyltransferase subunit C [Methanobacterium formicicum]MDH2659861.1 tetrahydromethanopterin S-methyltransferase subunit C [Methanobacterium formicicum]CEA13255.1 Tetrahydr